MNFKKTKDQFIEKARAVHGDKYDYTNTVYRGANIPLTIVCRKCHREITISPSNHYKGMGCKWCYGKSVTKEKFIEKARKVHGDRYDYSLVEISRFDDAVTVICPDHGPFQIKAFNHLHGGKCKKCGGPHSAITRKEFIRRAIEAHGNKYDYSQVPISLNTKMKITIGCTVHGPFDMKVWWHLSGQGCSKCFHDRRSSEMADSAEDFVRKAKAVHGDKYDYSNVKYKNQLSVVTIVCKKHGPFRKSAKLHLLGTGCPECKKEKEEKERQQYEQSFIERATDIHDGFYDYSKVHYIKHKLPVTIICPVHGEFRQSPASHLKGLGCQKCSESRGEKAVKSFLKKNNIHFIQHEIFESELSPNMTRTFNVDFYLPFYNTIVEFNGEQHYKIVNGRGDWAHFIHQQFRDARLAQYCEASDIRLITIHYNKIRSIDKILTDDLLSINVFK